MRGQGAERAIASEDVPRAQQGLERGGLGTIVGVSGGRKHLQQVPRARIQKGEQVGDGEPTTRALSTGLATVLLLCRSIGLRNTGHVHQERAVAPPPSLLGSRLLVAWIPPSVLHQIIPPK